MKYDFDKDDEVLEADDPIQEDKDRDVQSGKKYAREKKYHAVLVRTVSATPLDADLLPVSQQDVAEDNEEHEPSLPRAVVAKTAKQQISEKLAAAMADFGKLPKEPKVAANDNFRPTVSWPLMDQLTRSTFEPDKERRTKLIVTARYIRELIDLAEADPLGSSVHLPGKDTPTDHDVQRTESGKVFFEHGQTLDRKKVIYDSKDGEADATRNSGPVRTAKKSGPVSNSGFDLNRDDPFPVRVIAAREELDVIIAAVGPLWPSLKAAESDNATMTDVGVSVGAKTTQGSYVGVLLIRLALSAAMEALSRFNGSKDEPQRATPLPVKSRGSFRNQARGPVIKVAA